MGPARILWASVGILLLSVGVLSCTPHENPPPITGRVTASRLLEVDSGGPVGSRRTLPVLAVHLFLANPGAEVRLRGYRYETKDGIIPEALLDKRLVEESRSRMGRLVRLGLPTVFPPESTSEGWVFFRTSDAGGRLRLSLRDVYGRFSDLVLPVGISGQSSGPALPPAP